MKFSIIDLEDVIRESASICILYERLKTESADEVIKQLYETRGAKYVEERISTIKLVSLLHSNAKIKALAQASDAYNRFANEYMTNAEKFN